MSKIANPVVIAFLLLTSLFGATETAKADRPSGQPVCSFVHETYVDGTDRADLTVYVDRMPCSVSRDANKSLRIDWEDGVVTEIEYVQELGTRAWAGISLPQNSPVIVTKLSTGEMWIAFRGNRNVIYIDKRYEQNRWQPGTVFAPYP
jgi:hypothetical protein